MANNKSETLSMEVFIPALNDRIKGAPNDVKALEKLAEIYRKVGKPKEAGIVYKRLQTLIPEDLDIAKLSTILNQKGLEKNPVYDNDLPCPFLIYDDFFAQRQSDDVLEYTLENQQKFKQATFSREDTRGQLKRAIDKSYRNQLWFRPDEELFALFENSIFPIVPEVREKFCIAYEKIVHSNMEVAVTTDGQHGSAHSDRKSNSEHPMGSLLIFLYYFHTQPKSFEGGDLLLYDTVFPDGRLTEKYSRILPKHNRMVVFPACFYHEITKVSAKSDEIEDGRFAAPFWVQLSK